MDLQQYTQDALRTEAGAVDDIVVNEILLIAVLQQIMSAGRLLDQIKKHVFYGRPYNVENIGTDLSYMIEALQTLTSLSPAEIVEEEASVGINPRIFHAVVGMTTEAVELIEALRFHGMEMDTVNMLEEVGDSSWYQAILIDEAGGNWDDILHRNIEKLRTRFPEKFTQTAAIDRDTASERVILDKLQRSDGS